MADDLVPELISFYEYCEKEFNTTLIHKRQIIKPFTEEQEKNLWLKKANDIASENIFLDSLTYENLQIDTCISFIIWLLMPWLSVTTQLGVDVRR